MEAVQGGEVSHEHGVGLLLEHQLEDAVLPRLVDSRRRGADRAPRRPDALDGIAVVTNVGEVGVNLADPRGQGRLDLPGRSAEEMEDRIASRLGCFHLTPHRLIDPGDRPSRPGADRPRHNADRRGQEAFDEIATELADHAQGEHRGADDPGFEVPQLERCAAEAAELVAEDVDGEGMAPGRLCRLVGRHDHRGAPVAESGLDTERLPLGHGDFQVDRLAAVELIEGGPERIPQPGSQHRVIGFPDGLPGEDGGELEGTVSEGEVDPTALDGVGQRHAALENLVDAPPLGSVVAPAGRIEGHAVAAFHRRDEIDRHPSPPHGNDRAEPDPAFGAARCRHEPLVLAAEKPAGGETAREGELHRLDVAGGERRPSPGHRPVDRPPVVADDVGDVFRGLQPPLDLQARDPSGEELRRQVVGGEILGGEEVALGPEIDVATIADQLVGEPARLGALAAVGTPPPEGLARQALPRVGHTQRAMNEHLQLHRRPPADRPDLVDRQLPGQHHAFHAEGLGQADRLGTRQRHLGGGMERQLGTAGPQEPGHADILDKHRIDPTAGNLPGQGLDLPELPVEGERVEGHIPSDAMAVEGLDQPGKVGNGEIGRPGPGVVAAIEAEVDGIGPVFDRRADAVPVPGRGEELRGADRGDGGEVRGHASRV